MRALCHVLVRRRIQNQQADDVQVPHGVHAGHKGGAVLQANMVVAPLPVALAVLANDEEDDGARCADERRDDHELEPEDDSLKKNRIHSTCASRHCDPNSCATNHVKLASLLVHRRQAALLHVQVAPHFEHEVAQVEEVDARGDARQHEEGDL